MKRLNLFIAVILMISLIAGCGTAADKSDTTTQAAESTAAATTQETTAALEPVTISWINTGFGANYPAGIQTDPVAQEIEKRLGIKINVTDWSPTDEKTAALIASGDLPDVVNIQGKYQKQLVDGGQVIPLTPLLEDHGKDILQNYPQALMDLSISQATDASKSAVCRIYCKRQRGYIG